MANDDNAKSVRIQKTRDAAWNLVDDCRHLRETLAKPQPSSGDVRRMSNQLRRLLIDNGGDLGSVAAPRLGRKLMLQVPDFKREAKLTDDRDTFFVSLGGAGIFGSKLERFEIAKPNISYDGQEHAQLFGQRSNLVNPTTFLDVGLDGFLSQPVLFIGGRWFSRREVLKYVANEAGGVHSGTHLDADTTILRWARTFGAFYQYENGLALTVNFDAAMRGKIGLDVVRQGIDFVLLQAFSAAKFLLGSADIRELEAIIVAEFA